MATITAAGFSVGGHLADLRVNGPCTEQQAAIVTNFLGAFPGDVPALAGLASPIMAVNADVPPFLLIHGTRDEHVPL